MPIRIAVHSPASSASLATVDAGLGEYNVAGGLFSEVCPLHVIATGPAAAVVGGAIGRTWGECCELQQLRVSAEARDAGTGSALLGQFERTAASRGCTLMYLDTFSVQAPCFYATHGYVEVLRTTGFTGGVAKLTMHKVLTVHGTDV